MMRKVKLQVDHEIEEKGWDRAARVSVVLAGNRRRSELVIHFKGTPRNPMSQLDVQDKARKLTRTLLTAKQLGRLVESVNNLERIADVSAIGALLRKTA